MKTAKKKATKKKKSKHSIAMDMLEKAVRFEELLNRITGEVPFVDVKPYSHNIISLTLQQIDSEFGKKEANLAIRNCNLKKLGWKEVE